MPNALSILPVTPPPAPPASSTQSSGDSRASTFSDTLDQARQKDSSTAAKSAARSSGPSRSADKTAKAAPGKPARPARGKTAAKAQSDETGETDGNESAKSAADPAAAANVADGAPDQSVTTAENPKAKAPARAGRPAGETQGPQLAGAQQPAHLVKGVSKDPQESSRQGKDPSGKSSASAQEIEEDANSSTNPDSRNADLAAGQASAKHSPETSAVELGGGGGVAAGQSGAGNSPQAAASSSDDTAAAAIASDDDLPTAPTPAGADVLAGLAGSESASHAVAHAFSDVLASAQGQAPVAEKSETPAIHVAAAKAPPLPPEARFAEANQANIVTSVHAKLLPDGGSMQIRLDPPELGAMNVSVHMRDGVMTATFETTTDQAARLLTHNLGQLKTALESQGVSVGRLHVEQAPRDSQTSARDGGKNSDGGAHDQTGQQQQQDQQRREMLRRMWRRVNGGKDPLDLVA